MKAAHIVRAKLQIETYNKINRLHTTTLFNNKPSMSLAVYNVINPMAFVVTNIIRQSGQLDERY
jgi:hypothetical protein